MYSQTFLPLDLLGINSYGICSDVYNWTTILCTVNVNTDSIETNRSMLAIMTLLSLVILIVIVASIINVMALNSDSDTLPIRK